MSAWLDSGPAHQLFRTSDGCLLYRFLPTLGASERMTLRQPLERMLDIASREGTALMPPIERAFDRNEWLALVEDPVGRDVARIGGQLRLGHALWIGQELLRGLGPLHRAGLFHGAISTRRVVLDERGHVTLMDGGVALLAEQLNHGELRPATRGFGDIYREPACLPPELLSRGRLSPASDVFGVAALTFQLLTGRAAHRGGRALEVYGQLRRGERQRFADLPVDLPPHLARVLDESLVPDPLSRPTGDDLIDAIEANMGATLAPPTEVAHRRPTAWSSQLPERPPGKAPGPPGSASEVARQEAIRRAALQLELSRRDPPASGSSRKMSMLITLVVIAGLGALWPLFVRQSRGRGDDAIVRRARSSDAVDAVTHSGEDPDPGADEPGPAVQQAVHLTIGSERRIEAPTVRRRTPEREARQERHEQTGSDTR